MLQHEKNEIFPWVDEFFCEISSSFFNFVQRRRTFFGRIPPFLKRELLISWLFDEKTGIRWEGNWLGSGQVHWDEIASTDLYLCTGLRAWCRLYWQKRKDGREPKSIFWT
jgi:hypothetical protein